MYYDKSMTKEVVRYFYEHGVYGLENVSDCVDLGIITKDDFKAITSRYYDGYKKNGDTN